jgi:nitrile hydratase
VTYHSYADLGGQENAGAVVPEAEGDLFHHSWEPRVLAMTLAMGASGVWNLDMSRSARETLPDYPRLSYYQIWFEALRRLVLQTDLASQQEIDDGVLRQPPVAVPRVLAAARVAGVLAAGSPAARPIDHPPLFAPGDTVRTRQQPRDHHTRLPGYARGKIGTIERIHGAYIFADRHAQGLGEAPEWLYGVSFEGAALWPERGTGSVSIDAWEPYLEPAP